MTFVCDLVYFQQFSKLFNLHDLIIAVNTADLSVMTAGGFCIGGEEA